MVRELGYDVFPFSFGRLAVDRRMIAVSTGLDRFGQSEVRARWLKIQEVVEFVALRCQIGQGLLRGLNL
jgi:hypothetical protein